MKRFITVLLVLTMCIGCVAAYAEISETSLEFSRSGVIWQLPEAVRALPGRIMYTFDYGEGTVGSGMIKVYLTYTEWPDEKFQEIQEQAAALDEEAKFEEATALSQTAADAMPVLAYFFGIEGDRFTTEQALEILGPGVLREPVKIGEKGDFTFWMTVPDPDSAMMQNAGKQFSPEGIAALVQAQDEIMAHPEYAELTEAAAGIKTPAVGTRISFETTDLDGNPVKSEEIFSKNKLTLVNFYGQFCNACNAEMPELQRLNQEYADQGFEVLGIACVDFSTEEALEFARLYSEIYNIRTLRLNESVNNALYHLAMPTSYFIDSEGTVLTAPVVGAFSEQSFADIEAYLNGTSAELPTETDETNSNTQTWFIRVIDQNKDPVPDVFVNFCSDTACTPVELNENGLGSFTGPAGTYHISIVEVPDGYNADDVGDLSVDIYTTSITVTVIKE